MAYHIVCLAKAYNIPPSFVVNSDKIDIHFVPISKKCTCVWSRGSKHIHVLGIKDKRQVTMVVPSSATRLLLPLQVNFTSIMPKTLLPNNQRKAMCLANGWDLTYSENHWCVLWRLLWCLIAKFKLNHLECKQIK